MLKTGPRQIGQAVPTNRGASSTHKQRWPHGLTAIVGRCSKHTTHSDSGWEVIVDPSLCMSLCMMCVVFLLMTFFYKIGPSEGGAHFGNLKAGPERRACPTAR